MNIQGKGSTITFTDVFWRILASWKLVIILAIVGFVIASIYVSNTYSKKEAELLPTQMEYDRVMDDYKTELDRITAYNIAPQEERKTMAKDLSDALIMKLSTEQLSVVDNALSIKEQIIKNSKYKGKSILMKIDPYNVYTLYLVYETSSETAGLSNILNDYIGYVTSEECIKTIAGRVGWNTEEEMLSIYTELFTPVVLNGSQFAVTVSYPDNKVYDIAKALSEIIELYQIRVERNLGMHTLTKVEEQVKVIVNSSIANTQNTYNTQLSTYNTQLAGQINIMKAIPEQYNLYCLKSQIIDGNEEFNELISPGEPKIDVPKKLKSENTYKIIGMVLGVIVALSIVYLSMLFSKRLQKTEELYSIYGLFVAGYIYRKRKLVIDSQITRLHIGKDGPGNNESSIKLLSDRIAIMCEKAGIKKIGIVGTIIPKENSLELEKIINELKSKGIIASMIGNVLKNEESTNNIDNMEASILIETVNKSRYMQIRDEQMILDSMGVKILCAVGIE